MVDIINTSANYLVLDLESYELREEYNGPMEDPAILKNDRCRTTELWLKRIEPGTFVMGSPVTEIGRKLNENQHKVTISYPFYIGVFEITYSQYELIFDIRRSEEHGCLPVVGLTYNTIRGSKEGSIWPKGRGVDNTSFLGNLRLKSGIDFDLPTEAQWEFACRAGTTSALNNGKDLSDQKICQNLNEIGRYLGNFDDDKGGFSRICTKVGSYLPNSWGLYDMHGNLDEWCLDWYGPYESDDVNDPFGAFQGRYRVLRGGRWSSDALNCRSASRGYDLPFLKNNDLGFRVVINQISEEDKDSMLDTESSDENIEVVLPVENNDIHVNKQFEGENDSENVAIDIQPISKNYQTVNTVSKLKTDDKKETVENTEHRKNAFLSFKSKYIVLDLESFGKREESVGPMEDSKILKDRKCKTTELWLRRIEPGKFIMGSPENEIGRKDDERQHEVTISKPFYIGVFEITQKQYSLITGADTSMRDMEFLGDALPMENMSYNDTSYFLRQLRNKSSYTFDLPTEAQWEYACRAGTTSALNNGQNLTDKNISSKLGELGRYLKNGDGPVSVGNYAPNDWGLYDMHGNMCEWCLDWYGDYPNEAVRDPKGPEFGEDRVLRGGGWYYNAYYCRSAHRIRRDPDARFNYCGFRVVMIPPNGFKSLIP